MPDSEYVFNRQFIFSKRSIDTLSWPVTEIAGYWLYTHPNLEVTYQEVGNIRLCLIGFIFDYQNPASSNQTIVQGLVATSTFDELLDKLDEYSGQFAVIYARGDALYILNDAGAQREVYFDNTFSVFGSQPKLLQKIIPCEPHPESLAFSFYASKKFQNRKVFVGTSTHCENIFHLKPNHFIDVHAHVVMRFFPRKTIERITIADAAALGVKMLKGFIAAAAQRYDLRMGVTAGYDSRVLFLASLDHACQYFVSKIGEKGNDTDIAISHQLTSLHGREISVKSSQGHPISNEEKAFQDQSLDFPHYKALRSMSKGSLLINGNVSEIARSYYGNIRDVTVDDLLFFDKYQGEPFVRHEFQKWLDDSRQSIVDNGYHILDMFYWEERVGNWAAKNKTATALSTSIYSPFCSRKLLMTLLATARKDRDRNSNLLYNEMIRLMSPVAARLPINPSVENTRMKFLKRIHVYDTIKNMARKYRWLKKQLHGAK